LSSACRAEAVTGLEDGLSAATDPTRNIELILAFALNRKFVMTFYTQITRYQPLLHRQIIQIITSHNRRQTNE
jgi:precorrin-3B methylase